jgi:release factor glutamine methyltransferase
MNFKAVAAVLKAARQRLIAADIDGSALDARLLLEAACGLTHEDVVAMPERVLSLSELQKFEMLLLRRLAHEPVSRILGTREFYGREFLVTPDVLDPRPDTETLIELALELLTPSHHSLLDLGTGSGAIVVTLLAERFALNGVAVDVSQAALEVARQNAGQVAPRLQFHRGSWFEGLTGKFDLIVSNPPYISKLDIPGLGDEVKNFDPHLALDGGQDGLDAYRSIAAGAGAFLSDIGFVILEIGAGQREDVAKIFADKEFAFIDQRQDLGGHTRALAFSWQN